MPLPCSPRIPASITSHFDESIMNGTLATSGSLASSDTKRAIAATPSIIPSSMQMSMTLAPLSTCWRATATASSYFPSLISFANFGEPATLVRSPIMMKEPICCVNGCEPDRRSGARRLGRTGAAADGPAARRRCAAGGRSASARAIAAMCSGVLPQQPPAMFTRPPSANCAEVAGHVGRLEIEAGRRQRVRQPRVRIAGDRRARLGRQLGQERIHQVGTERAVEADAERLHVLDGVPQRLDGLRRDHRLAAPPHRRRDHDRQRLTVLLEHLLNGDQRRLGVQRIEDRLDQQHVAAARDQRAHLVGVSRLDLVERHHAEPGVLGVG